MQIKWSCSLDKNSDTAVAVNQGRRAGAVTVALDTWHLDIETLLKLQTEMGTKRKAYDIYHKLYVQTYL